MVRCELGEMCTFSLNVFTSLLDTNLQHFGLAVTSLGFFYQNKSVILWLPSRVASLIIAITKIHVWLNTVSEKGKGLDKKSYTL